MKRMLNSPKKGTQKHLFAIKSLMTEVRVKKNVWKNLAKYKIYTGIMQRSIEEKRKIKYTQMKKNGCSKFSTNLCELYANAHIEFSGSFSVFRVYYSFYREEYKIRNLLSEEFEKIYEFLCEFRKCKNFSGSMAGIDLIYITYSIRERLQK